MARSALEAVPAITSAGSLSTMRLKIVRTVSESSTIITRIAPGSDAASDAGRGAPVASASCGGKEAGRLTQTRQAAT